MTGVAAAPEATRAAGLDRLAAFAPRAGRAYAEGRNTDPGPDRDTAVSALSPYLRRRLVLEHEAVDAARAAHGSGAEKFIQEVFWRTYWKGFLEQRPAIWTAYRAEVARGWDRIATEGGMRRVFSDATEGQTGIACFDAWAHELVQRNWLHNHARMWFASIWVFTLRLPWALGADFFARHLLDGDPASNTLSWRWVAGLHTSGKHYVARADNISRYTQGRFDPRGDLDEDPAPLQEAEPFPEVTLPPPDLRPHGEAALLLHDDDLGVETLDLDGMQVRTVAGFSAVAGIAERGVAEPVAAFARGAVEDGLVRAAARFGCAAAMIAPADLRVWAASAGLPVVTAYAPVGPVAEALRPLQPVRLLREWDAAAWPLCTRGYFRLRAAIPDLLAGRP